jgi:hypothetical protein
MPPRRTRKEKIKAKPLTGWTIMVYMAGDNNLSSECIWALTEMKRAASSDQINIIAQFDPGDEYSLTRRFEIKPTGPSPYANPVQGYGQETAAEPEPLDEAISDSANFNPRTGEVHFKHESRKADFLADKRREQRDARDDLIKALKDEKQFINIEDIEESYEAGPNDTDMASPITLYNFLSFGVEYYPARNYLVVVSGHSAGVLPNYLLKDEGSGRSMTIDQLKAVFQQLIFDLARHDDGRSKIIDVLGFDTCLMSMVEICYQLRGLVGQIIGSETYTPAFGWPYNLIISKISECLIDKDGKPLENPKSSAEIALAIVESYEQFYRDYMIGGVSTALSAIYVSKIEGSLVPCVRELSAALICELWEDINVQDGKNNGTRPFKDALILAHWEAQSYNGELYVDLIDFCECLSRRCPQGRVWDACDKVIKAATEVVIKSVSSGPAYQYSNGCSIYFPWSEVGRYIFRYDFANDTNWADFLAVYTDLTRRDYRRPEKPNAKQLEQIKYFNESGANAMFDFDSGKISKISSNKISSDKISSDKISSDKISSDKISSDKISSDKISSDKISSDKISSDKMSSDKMSSDKISSDKMSSDKMSSDKMSSDKMGSDKTGKPIFSMRNPPIVAIDLDGVA